MDAAVPYGLSDQCEIHVSPPLRRQNTAREIPYRSPYCSNFDLHVSLGIRMASVGVSVIQSIG